MPIKPSLDEFRTLAAGHTVVPVWREVRAALEVALAWGCIDAALVAEAELDRVLAMVWRLTRRPPP